MKGFRVPATIQLMDVKKITHEIQFSSQKMQKLNLFESSRMFCDLYCLEPGQKQKVHSHAGNDKIYFVVQGEGHFTVGQDTRRLESGEITVAFSGEPHGLENSSQTRLTCVVFMAPHPSWENSASREH